MTTYCLDIEATGTDPSKDRIISLAILNVDNESDQFLILCNPAAPIPDEATAVHGLTNDRVADLPTFEHYAQQVHDMVKGQTLLGFNLQQFDVPLLWEELYRCGIEWDVSQSHILDAGVLFKKREARTLSAAVQFYLGREHRDAHDAMGDVLATRDVWRSQLQTYRLEDKPDEVLEEESTYKDSRVDLAGKLYYDSNGRVTYNLGNVKGTTVESNPSFGEWMLTKDFSANTKMHVSAELARIYEARQKPEVTEDDE